jgi:hypothetical protein
MSNRFQFNSKGGQVSQRSRGMLPRNRLTRAAGVLLGAGALVLGMALPALAMSRTVGQGTPGYVHGTTATAIEGGVCGASGETVSCSSSLDQIFVDNYNAYTAPYNVAQTVTSEADLYYYNGSGWVLLTTKSEGSCRGLAGNGNASCQFGHNAPDQGSQPWTPAFYNMSRGNSWTVVIRVSWYNYATGALLSYADYRPTTTADLGCASYARGLGRCYGPNTSSGVTYISMP